MQRWNDLMEVPSDIAGSVLTIGTFDGVHRGHQRLLAKTVERARELDLPAVIVTFDPHPMRIVRPDAAPALLAGLERRLELFERYGADATVVLPFTKERSRQSAEDFVRELVGALRPRLVVVGDDFRFGHKATGDVAGLKRLGVDLASEPGAAGGDAGFDVETLSRGDGDTGWSSTAIRERLAAGDVARATELLGHAFRVEGVVIAGADRGGRLLGFPTANIPVDAESVTPADGVYAGWLTPLSDSGPTTAEPLPAAISVGTNPQFGDEPRRVEAHVIDRDDLELYGTRVAVDFVERLRGQATFDSLDELIEQIGADITQVRARLADSGGT